MAAEESHAVDKTSVKGETLEALAVLEPLVVEKCHRWAECTRGLLCGLGSESWSRDKAYSLHR